MSYRIKAIGCCALWVLWYLYLILFISTADNMTTLQCWIGGLPIFALFIILRKFTPWEWMCDHWYWFYCLMEDE